MRYWEVLIAIAALLFVFFAPSFFPTQENAPILTDDDAKTIAENYVETNIENAIVTGATITNKANGVWKITVNYQQGTGSSCKVGKCYWEGPASQYCRIESNQSLGQCT